MSRRPPGPRPRPQHPEVVWPRAVTCPSRASGPAWQVHGPSSQFTVQADKQPWGSRQLSPIGPGEQQHRFPCFFCPRAAKKKKKKKKPLFAVLIGFPHSLQAWHAWTAVGSGPWARVQGPASWVFLRESGWAGGTTQGHLHFSSGVVRAQGRPVSFPILSAGSRIPDLSLPAEAPLPPESLTSCALGLTFPAGPLQGSCQRVPPRRCCPPQAALPRFPLILDKPLQILLLRRGGDDAFSMSGPRARAL